ncbi:hypothetical protein AVEN_45064-1 [Araneus ventricosus]|uniref:Uncharacterized protein n=1 Tax=Araneus ventricosus TaxID=182803 RepID=A0A4Y2RM68_ARAVE|nr:hypothetical protein AVEN_45064-1 [Araneus ventricosus]
MSADDTAILAKNRNPKYTEAAINQNFEKLDEWFLKWNIALNVASSSPTPLKPIPVITYICNNNSESTRAVPMNVSLYLALTISMLLYAYPPASLSTGVPVRLQQDVTDPVPDGSSPRKSLPLFSKTNTVRLLTSHPCLRLLTLIAQIL